MSGSAFQRGVAHLAGRRFLRARVELVRSVRAGGDDAQWAVQELIQTFLRRGEASLVDAFLRDLLDDRSPLLWHGLAYFARATGRPREALAHAERACELRSGPWAGTVELGWILCVVGSPERGRLLLRKASRHFERAGDAWGHATATTHLAADAMRSWRLDEALKLFDRAVVLKRRCGDRVGLATCLYNQGLSRYFCCDWRGALALLKDAHAIQREVGFGVGACASLNTIGSCHVELGEPEMGAARFREVVRLGRRLRTRAAEAHVVAAITNLAAVAHLEGDVRSARRHYEAALGRLDDEALRAEHGVLLAANLAQLHVQSGRPGVALEILRRIEADDAGPRARMALLTQEARALLASGDARGALAAAGAAVAHGRFVAGPRRRFLVQDCEARLVQARARIDLGERASARRLLADVGERVEDLLALQDSVTERAGLLEWFRDLVDAQVECALASGAEAAWKRAQEGKARFLRHAISAGRGRSTRSSADAAELRQLAAADGLTAAQASRMRELAHRRAGGRTGPGVEASVDAERLGRRLGDDAAIVEYHVTERRLHVFRIHGGSVAHRAIALPAWRLRRLVERFVAPLRAVAAGGSHAGREELDEREARRLHALLLAPILRDLPPDVGRLVVVPDGALHGLPFHLLGDSLRIVVAPSSALVAAGRHRGSRGVLALAWSPPPGTFVDWAGDRRELVPLRHAEAEVAAIEAAWRGAASVASVVDATVQDYRDRAGDARVLHVAAHALVDPVVASNSAILLAPARRGEPPGLLTAAEIAAIPLTARLVILSACDGGAGRVRAGEGQMSLARAFLAAGASAVIASAWPLDDEAAWRLAAELHGALSGGSTPEEALRRARQTLRGAGEVEPRFAHPATWGAFVLTDLCPRD